MYFICEGVVEVLATDEKTLIRFMSKGSYFGEIGILLEPHKRSCSVVSRTNTLLYYVKADDMMELLVEAPEQMDQLKKVALARLKTTKPEDFTMNKEQERHMIDVQLQQLESCYTVFGKPQPD